MQTSDVIHLRDSITGFRNESPWVDHQVMMILFPRDEFVMSWETDRETWLRIKPCGTRMMLPRITHDVKAIELLLKELELTPLTMNWGHDGFVSVTLRDFEENTCHGTGRCQNYAFIGALLNREIDRRRIIDPINTTVAEIISAA